MLFLVYRKFSFKLNLKLKYFDVKIILHSKHFPNGYIRIYISSQKQI